MTHEIKISVKPENVLPDIFDWLNEQGWEHIVDWRWFRPKADTSDNRYIFQFDDQKKANWFAMRWSSGS
jgi:hypothetical protein